MDAITVIRSQLRDAHGFLEATIQDVDPELAHWPPPGTANPLGATYAHIITSEDMLVQGLLRHSAPLFATTWAGRTGISEPMPMPGPEWEHYGAWARRVQVDLGALREYAQAVYATTDTYLATLVPDVLGQTLDLSAIGMGQVSLAWVFSRLLIGHVDNICGEIACLKGIQGVRGYPM
jgi:DinB family protein